MLQKSVYYFINLRIWLYFKHTFIVIVSQNRPLLITITRIEAYIDRQDQSLTTFSQTDMMFQAKGFNVYKNKRN